MFGLLHYVHEKHISVKSNIVLQDLTLPGVDLFAAVLTAATGHVVFMSLGDLIKKLVHLTDSQVAIFQICNTKSQQKQWFRNRFIEINRLTDKSRWFNIESEKNMAVIGTRRGCSIEDASEFG